MLIECPKCEAKVHGKQVAEMQGPKDDLNFSEKFCLLQCPSCEGPLLTRQVLYEEHEDGLPNLMYPFQRKANYEMPIEVARSLDEALKCYRVKAYVATAIMCRRTLEAVCHSKLEKFKDLYAGIRHLRDRQIIEGQLFDWAEALRKDGNLAAHQPDSTMHHEDAGDLLDFTQALLDYVFILREKYDAFTKRRQDRTKA